MAAGQVKSHKKLSEFQIKIVFVLEFILYLYLYMYSITVMFLFLQCTLQDKGYHGFIISVSNVYRSIALACIFIHLFIHPFDHLFVQNQVS